MRRPSALAPELRRRVRAALEPSLRPVLNATGVVLHTNLGRAPLAEAALARVQAVAGGYSNLELDLATGGRGSRQDHVAALVCELTGAEAAICVNNGAAALVLALAALAGGREIVVSRGQLVEIGDGFRIPEIVQSAGARLREVGTTNRTRRRRLPARHRHRDGRAAVRAPVELPRGRLHGRAWRRANWRRSRTPPRSPWSTTSARARCSRLPELAGEPLARDALRDGCDLVCFSGDKLLGGPQAGILAGTAEAIATCRRHPLARALRIDKLSLAALEATLRIYRDPARRACRAARPARRARARRGRARARRAARRRASAAAVVETVARVGGGALPLAELPSFGVRLEGDADLLAARLREGDPAVLARVSDGALVLDCRTLSDADAARISAPAMTEEQAAALTLGTAGHIDHGKTALVRALTGVDTDRLPEEQARGISIALGYASLPLPSGRSLSVVDVPGHERFVRTMISGATGIDLALLVVACDDGVMPQTREHVAILELLGVRTAVVALTKRDLVDDEGAELARADVEELLGGHGARGRADRRDVGRAPAPASTTCAPRSIAAAGDRRAAARRGRDAPADRPRLHAARHRHGRDGHAVVGVDRRRRPARAHARRRRGARALGRRCTTSRSSARRPASGSPPASWASSAARSRAARRWPRPARSPRATGSTSSCRRCRSGPGVAHGALVQVLVGTACVDARVALLEPSALRCRARRASRSCACASSSPRREAIA